MNLAVSLYSDQPIVLAERLDQLSKRHRFVELRLDRIPADIDWQCLQPHQHDLRIILACVPQSEGGLFGGDEVAWAARIESAAQAFADNCLIDVPPCFAASQLLPDDIPRIWSWHQKQGQGPVDWPAVHQSLAAKARIDRGDVIKTVAWADCHEDALAILPLYQRSGPPLVAFAQGPGGAATRLWALALGAPWTYACWQGETTAPGQWSEHQVRVRQNWTGIPLLGVLGDPVAHSRSPRLWQTAFQVLGLQQGQLADDALNWAEALYLPLQQSSLARFAQAHRNECFQAFSVTAPLKLQALQLADHIDASAEAVGAANLLIREGCQWRAANTDGPGALNPLRAAGFQVEQPVLIVGAGGAARAAAHEALLRGHRVTIAARRLQAAQELAGRFAHLGEIHALDLADPKLLSGPAGAVIQATPLGSEHQPGDPLKVHAMPQGWIFLDMVYQPAETELLRRARLAGNLTLGGHHMLLAQMLQQFELVVGRQAMPGPLKLALDHDLGLAPAPIFLIGPRASGKSTLGRRLAVLLGWDFLDADTELEKRHQRSISEWLPADQAGFRQAEAELLKELVTHTGAVIALGGGVIEQAASVELLAAQKRVLGLEASPEELRARRQGDDRPALTELSLEQECEVLATRRKPLYEIACHGRWINVGGKEIVAFLQLLESLNLIV